MVFSVAGNFIPNISIFFSQQNIFWKLIQEEKHWKVVFLIFIFVMLLSWITYYFSCAILWQKISLWESNLRLDPSRSYIIKLNGLHWQKLKIYMHKRLFNGPLCVWLFFKKLVILSLVPKIMVRLLQCIIYSKGSFQLSLYHC